MDSRLADPQVESRGLDRGRLSHVRRRCNCLHSGDDHPQVFLLHEAPGEPLLGFTELLGLCGEDRLRLARKCGARASVRPGTRQTAEPFYFRLFVHAGALRPCTLRYMLGSKAHAKKFQLQRKALPSVICPDSKTPYVRNIPEIIKRSLI